MREGFVLDVSELMWISNLKKKKKILTVLKVKTLSFMVKNQEQEFYFAEALS